jgi:polyhydroxyalkanoate synthase subunit PhaC
MRDTLFALLKQPSCALRVGALWKSELRPKHDLCEAGGPLLAVDSSAFKFTYAAAPCDLPKREALMICIKLLAGVAWLIGGVMNSPKPGIAEAAQDGRGGSAAQGQAVSVFGAADGLRAFFTVADVLRRAQSGALEAFGLGLQESPYQIVTTGSYWCLRDYVTRSTSPSLLIVAAPIKRPYIWDIAPSVSAIRRCLQEGFHVYLIEWTPEADRTQNSGLDEHSKAISECVAMITRQAGGRRPYLTGHSLGGTLAGIFSALEPASVRGLVLLGAPLCFEPATSKFRDALVALLPSDVSEADSFPGSLLSYMAALAAPGTFFWSRLLDAALSVTDGRALEIHALVERWSLDEVAVPGKLVHQITQWLFRENRFCRGTLEVCGAVVGSSSLSVPTFAVVNTADEIAPLTSIKACIDAMPVTDARIIKYPGETGVGLQHLGVLVGRQAHARVWPEIIAWLKGHKPDPGCRD